MKKHGKVSKPELKSAVERYASNREAALAMRRPDELLIEANSEAEMPKELANEVVGPTLASSLAITPLWKKLTSVNLDLTNVRNSLKQAGDKIKNGDMSDVEAMLYSQAAALNLMFAEMNRRAMGALYSGNSFEGGKAYMAIALKAQNQSRMTLESLGNIKKTPAVFARQANINNCGHQQVNNGADSRAPATENQSSPSKLVEVNDETPMDLRAEGKTLSADSQLATVGTLDRAEVA